MTTNNPVGAMSKLHEAQRDYALAVRENCEGVTAFAVECDSEDLKWLGGEVKTLARYVRLYCERANATAVRPDGAKLSRIIAEAICDEFGSGEVERAAAAIIMAASLEG
jgi:hypothetical protein